MMGLVEEGVGAGFFEMITKEKNHIIGEYNSFDTDELMMSSSNGIQ